MPGSALYQRRHRRVRAARGLARDQQCAYGDHPAAQWAFIHGCDPDSVSGYAPMCAEHHVAYDDGRMPRPDVHDAMMSPPRTRGSRLTTEDHRTIVSMRRAGATLREIGQVVACSGERVRQVLRDAP